MGLAQSFAAWSARRHSAGSVGKEPDGLGRLAMNEQKPPVGEFGSSEAAASALAAMRRGTNTVGPPLDPLCAHTSRRPPSCPWAAVRRATAVAEACMSRYRWRAPPAHAPNVRRVAGL